MEETLISYQAVDIYQQELCVLEGVDLTLAPGELVYLTGRVGSGKSSLLKSLYGEVDVKRGNACVLGFDLCRLRRKRLPDLRRRLGIVFQDFQLLMDRTVTDNLDFVLRATGWKEQALISRRIEEALSLVGMERKGYKCPYELSGGEQQRVAIARAVLNRPPIILADEPTGNLDAETGRAIMAVLQGLSRSGTLVVVTTHNTGLLREFPGRVFCCRDHRLTEQVSGGKMDEIEINN